MCVCVCLKGSGRAGEEGWGAGGGGEAPLGIHSLCQVTTSTRERREKQTPLPHARFLS